MLNIFFFLLYINYYICYLTFLWLGEREGMAETFYYKFIRDIFIIKDFELG